MRAAGQPRQSRLLTMGDLLSRQQGQEIAVRPPCLLGARSIRPRHTRRAFARCSRLKSASRSVSAAITTGVRAAAVRLVASEAGPRRAARGPTCRDSGRCPGHAQARRRDHRAGRGLQLQPRAARERRAPRRPVHRDGPPPSRPRRIGRQPRHRRRERLLRRGDRAQRQHPGRRR